MKFIYIALVIVSVFLLAYSSAEDVTCAGDDLVCVRNGGNCSHNALCEKGTYCDIKFDIHGKANFTCTSQLALNAACDSDNKCLNSENDDVICWNGTCQATSTAQTLGQVCNELLNCKNEYYCNSTDTGVCLQGVAAGQNCTDEVQCDATSICSEQGICIKYFSLKEGDLCEFMGSYVEIAPDCGAGLYCKNNYTTGDSVCAKGFSSSLKACNTTDDCAYPETCQCNPETEVVQCTAPRTLTSSSISALMNLFECSITENCDQEDPKCCRKYQCDAAFIETPEASYKKYVALTKPCGFDDPLGFCETKWGRFSTAEKAGIIVGVIAIVVVVAGLIIFFVKRRQHKYNRIH